MARKPTLTGQVAFTSEAWNHLCNGSEEAFANLYEAYAKSLFSYGYRISNNENAVKDAVQDLFIDLWRSRKKLGKVADIKSYLFQSLRYKLIRQSKLSVAYIAEDALEHLRDEEHSIESVIINKEEGNERHFKMQKALSSLSLRQQEAIGLKFYHGFTTEQIAEIMGVNYQSANNILYRAILSLRRYFNSSVACVVTSFLCLYQFF